MEGDYEGNYRLTQGQWRKYTPPGTLRGEQKRIEVELWQKGNKFNLQRKENNIRETQEVADRKREFHSVIEKIRNMPKKDEAGTSSSNTEQSPVRS